MLSRIRFYLKHFDWLVFAAICLLLAFSLVEIYSVALGQEKFSLLNFQKQLAFAGLGLVLLFVFSFIDANFIRSLKKYLYILAVLVLIAVLVFGSTIRGTKGWFNIFGFGLQPVEFVKIILIIWLSDFFASLATKVKTAKHFFRSAIGAFFLILLVLLQPDFGSSLILVSIWLVLIIAAGFPWKYLLAIVLSGILVFGVAWLFLFKDYQKERVMTFIDPSANSLESGYNISQAMIAVGSGGLTGKGVGFGSQSQLKFLPEAQNDFIFAVIAEELGLLGVLLVLGFYSIFFWRSLAAVKRLNNDYGIYFIIGASGLIFIQMFINIGMNIGIMPVVGLPLPFVSYGGSSLLALMILAGMVENIIIKSKISY